MRDMAVRKSVWPICVQLCETETGHLAEKGISQSKTPTGYSQWLPVSALFQLARQRNLLKDPTEKCFGQLQKKPNRLHNLMPRMSWEESLGLSSYYLYIWNHFNLIWKNRNLVLKTSEERRPQSPAHSQPQHLISPTPPPCCAVLKSKPFLACFHGAASIILWDFPQ